MDQNSHLLHGSFIRLQHQQEKGYLFSDTIYLNGGSKTQLVGCCKNGPGSIRSIWQIFRKKPSNQKEILDEPLYDGASIWWDDTVYLVHYATKTYLQIHNSEKSQVTKQQEASTSYQEQLQIENYFTIQRIDDPYPKQKQICQKIQDKSVLCLMNLNQLCTLHSHKVYYKQKDAQDFNEVTGFKGSDTNDYWQVHLVPDEELKQTDNIQQPVTRRDRPITQVHKQDQIILRNAFYGSSLHSHSHTYKKSNNQEVTNMYSLPRDDNDWWEIVEMHSEDNKSNLILNGSVIGLIHLGSKKHLASILGEKSPSGIGLEVSCKSGNPKANEWLIEGLTIQTSQMMVTEISADTPIVIKHIPTDTFLSATKEPSNYSPQNEVTLIPKITYKSIWRIECVDSIFA